ncbi:hypothetical protein HL658_32060 [Azospirillum sp. RWY-5-1]|uniref:Hedgehog/Intein (Hint) domain-containing protein n=1 Tax=Azospirillum oleiclasticum TaxID=2735135 RepID=A0ABX2TFG7_9PROT|nr:hypothetical protein [Azospirillum oleiclasticum]NYZ17204.1 hypothetical protein [Azospirillum oleiclasticum]NYZ23087.1 hypothetical protein [Azospirillum oleiclasticum]
MRPDFVTRTTLTTERPTYQEKMGELGHVPFIHYDPATGRVVQTGHCSPVELDHQAVAGCERLDGLTADINADYVDLSGGFAVVRPRPALPGFDKTTILADGQDVATILLPDPCTVTINGTAHIVEGGRLELVGAYPGAYRVVIDQFPHLPFEETVTCASP